jgi:hypothetical protein
LQDSKALLETVNLSPKARLGMSAQAGAGGAGGLALILGLAALEPGVLGLAALEAGALGIADATGSDVFAVSSEVQAADINPKTPSPRTVLRDFEFALRRSAALVLFFI